jgi:hypothetical protein
VQTPRPAGPSRTLRRIAPFFAATGRFKNRRWRGVPGHRFQAQSFRRAGNARWHRRSSRATFRPRPPPFASEANRSAECRAEPAAERSPATPLETRRSEESKPASTYCAIRQTNIPACGWHGVSVSISGRRRSRVSIPARMRRQPRSSRRSGSVFRRNSNAWPGGLLHICGSAYPTRSISIGERFKTCCGYRRARL